MAVAKYSGIIVNLCVIAVLSRILKPEDFGTVSLISVFIGFFSLVSDFGIASAIIQKRDLTNEDYSNILGFTIYFALFLCAVYLVSLLPISTFYHSDTIFDVGCCLVVQVFFVTVNIVPNALLLKNQRFKFVAKRTFIIYTVTGAMAITSSLIGLGIYSLIVVPFISSIAIFVANYSQYPIRYVFVPRFESIKKILSYSTYSLMYNLTNYFSRNLDKFILGKVFSLNSLGYYEKSYSIVTMPVQNVISVINPVMHPILSNYQSDKEKMANYLVQLIKILSLVGMSLTLFVYFSSADIVHFLLGKNWDSSIPIIEIFSLSIMIQIVYSLQGPFFLAIGNTSMMFRCGLVTTLLIILSLIVGVYMNSLSSVAWCLTLSYYITTLYTFYFLYLKLLGGSCCVFVKSFANSFFNLIITSCLIVIYDKFTIDINPFVNLILVFLVCLAGLILTVLVTRDRTILSLLKR